MRDKMIGNLLSGKFKEFKDSIVSTLFSKIAEQIEDAKTEIANNIFNEESESDDVEYKERVNGADKNGYPEEDDEDDLRGGEFLVDLKFTVGNNTSLENFRVVGTSKADIVSRLNNMFGKGKFIISKIKLDESVINELKASTLGSYIGKSKSSEDRAEAELEKEEENFSKRPVNKERVSRLNKIIDKRSEGRHAAMGKLRSGDYQNEAVVEEGCSKVFKKVEKKAEKEYGSKEIGEKVAGSVVSKIKAKMIESTGENHVTHYGSFSEVLEAAKEHALKSGYKHDPEEFDTITNTGFIKPSEAKTHAFHVSLKDKNTGKEIMNKIHNFQITGNGYGKFNINQDIS